MLSDVDTFSIPSSESPIVFHDKTLDVLVKNQKHFLYEKYIKRFCNVPKEIYLTPLRILYPFIKSFANPFVDIVSTLFDSSFNLFSTSTCFILFELILLLKLNKFIIKICHFYEISNIIFAC